MATANVSKTFKLDPETVELLQQIMQASGLSWDGVVSMLANLYTAQEAAKSVGRETELQDFVAILNKAQEAYKTYHTTLANLESADENLRTATVGFREGVVTSDDVMAAQTAWRKANSENIDAMIDVRLSNTYLSKVLGTMDIGAYSAEK